MKNRKFIGIALKLHASLQDLTRIHLHFSYIRAVDRKNLVLGGYSFCTDLNKDSISFHLNLLERLGFQQFDISVVLNNQSGSPR
jgi:hypothetical protein